MLREKAERYLKAALQNPSATFRDGQWESIEALLNHQKVLVVQRTGWGKSMVYFLATRLLRDQGKGPALLISPLLSLMRNQLLAAKHIGLRAMTINSSNKEEHEEVYKALRQNSVDLLLISPERLANDEFKHQVLDKFAASIGLFIIDEAHCISDWGHDFRPDYRRIVRVLKFFPPNSPVLATTATANNRVVDDIKEQLGSDLRIQRGTLVRESLRLQNIKLASPGARLAWLAQVIPTLPGSGIVYTLTKRDALIVCQWLCDNGIVACPYYSGVENEQSQSRESLEDGLLQNKIKVLVATVALGMGFDKPDITFVIHYQRPASVVHYYQQVGRAGRCIDNAYGILLSGREDDDIADYFRKSAFPPENHVWAVLNLLREAGNGASVLEMQRSLNLTKTQLDKVLQSLTLADRTPVTKVGPRWYATPAAISYSIDQAHIDLITRIREDEQEEMQRYMDYDGCLMSFLQKALDDPSPQSCGHCQACSPERCLETTVSLELINKANHFLRHNYHPISPRKCWPVADMFAYYDFSKKMIPETLRAEEGKALCLWRDDGWGTLVYEGKYKTGQFDRRLVEACVDMIREWSPFPKPMWVCCIPSSRHPDLVPNFTMRLAEALELPYESCLLLKRVHDEQKTKNNSYQQAKNLDGVFSVENNRYLQQPCLLIDDMVDSGWTFTIASALLRQKGCPAVFPLALAMNSLG